MDKIARGFINIIHYVDAYALLCLSLLLEHRAGTGAGGRAGGRALGCTRCPNTSLEAASFPVWKVTAYQFGGWLNTDREPGSWLFGGRLHTNLEISVKTEGRGRGLQRARGRWRGESSMIPLSRMAEEPLSVAGKCCSRSAVT